VQARAYWRNRRDLVVNRRVTAGLPFLSDGEQRRHARRDPQDGAADRVAIDFADEAADRIAIDLADEANEQSRTGSHPVCERPG
jgi:hypothetical protein